MNSRDPAQIFNPGLPSPPRVAMIIVWDAWRVWVAAHPDLSSFERNRGFAEYLADTHGWSFQNAYARR